MSVSDRPVLLEEYHVLRLHGTSLSREINIASCKFSPRQTAQKVICNHQFFLFQWGRQVKEEVAWQ